MKTLFTLLTASAFSLLSQAQSFQSIESVEYDPVGARFIVSNGSSIIQADGNGNAVATLPSPMAAGYGMEVMNNQLYAIHNNAVKVFDLTSGALLKTISITGASFLNGMASNGTDIIWVTDFSAKKIHSIEVSDLNNPVVTNLVGNTTTTPNGIVFDANNNRLVFVSWGGNAPIKSVDPATGTIITLTSTTLGNCDGIDMDANGNFFVASWSPNRITKYNSDFSIAQTITVAGGLSSPADICYATENDTLAIPNSGNNTVVYVGFENIPNSISEVDESEWKMFQNQQQWEIQYLSNTNNEFDVSVFSISGQLMHQGKWNVDQGTNRLIIPHQNWNSGAYFISCRSNSEVSEFKVIK